jgi:hypothetical protein
MSMAYKSCEDGKHCLHEKIYGQKIPPSAKRCCMCKVDVYPEPLLWEGDNS